MEYGGLGFIDAVKELAQMQGMPVPRRTFGRKSVSDSARPARNRRR